MSVKNIVESLAGWCTAEKAGIISDLVKTSDSQLTVELGVFGGRSLIPMALAHKQKGTGFCIGIDSWKKDTSLHGTNDPANDEYWSNVDFPSVYRSVQQAIELHSLQDYCDTLRISSQAAAKLFNDSVIDILHQDSAHNVETITEELELWIPKLKVGGYWIADDTDWKEAKGGYNKLPEYGLELIEDHEKWQIWRKVK